MNEFLPLSLDDTLQVVAMVLSVVIELPGRLFDLWRGHQRSNTVVEDFRDEVDPPPDAFSVRSQSADSLASDLAADKEDVCFAILRRHRYKILSFLHSLPTPHKFLCDTCIETVASCESLLI